MISKRQQLEQWTTVVADTGDLERIAELRPHDATTNPSLLLAAARDERYRHLLDQARELARELGFEMPATALNMALYDKVIEAGLGNLDHSALIKAIDPD